MIGSPRLRRLAEFGAVATLALALGACAREYPNSTFTPHSEYGRAIDFLWNRLLFLGTLVFIFVEAGLLFVVFKYRRRNDDIVPPQTHGNTTLEITWTLIPAAILVFVAVPTVRTIFQTQAPAPANALQIEVFGHQWWWEFKYRFKNANGQPDSVITANEIYVPKGRTVNLTLRTQDVLHSFWVPQLAGKRDLIANHTNYIWFTPDPTMPTTVWNGFCTEYCGSSHANMRFRVVTVDSAQFEGWIQHQQSPAAFNSAPQPAPNAGPIRPTDAAAAQPNAVTAVQTAQANMAAGPVATPKPPVAASIQPSLPATGQFVGYILPKESIPAYAIPHGESAHPIQFNDALQGDPARGEKLFVGAGTCFACHSVTGNPMAVGKVGPNLTHVGSRIAIGAGIFPNDASHLARWIKNARVMKPGNIMPTLGKGEIDPQTNQKTPGGLDDQQVADLVAYLQALK